jgi:fatty acid desaturase
MGIWEVTSGDRASQLFKNKIIMNRTISKILTALVIILVSLGLIVLAFSQSILAGILTIVIFGLVGFFMHFISGFRIRF